MTREWVDYANRDPHAAGCRTARSGGRQNAALEGVFGEPDGGEVGRFRGASNFDAVPRLERARQPRADLRQGLEGHTPPGRGASLAGEKCTCTTRQSPSSLRNTMVEREMKSLP